MSNWIHLHIFRVFIMQMYYYYQRKEGNERLANDVHNVKKYALIMIREYLLLANHSYNYLGSYI